MKFFNSIFNSTVMVALVFAALPRISSAELEPFRLAREVQFEMTNLKEFALDSKSEKVVLHLRFATAVDDALYYYGYVYESGGKFEANTEVSFYVRVLKSGGTSFDFTLISLLSSDSSQSNVEMSGVASRFDGKGKFLTVKEVRKIKFLKKDGSTITLTEKSTDIPYWIKYNAEAVMLKSKLKLQLITSLVSPDEGKQAEGALTVTGSIDFFRGDGCEKGNVFMLENESKSGPNVNVVKLDFGQFYVPKDYDTLPSPLLKKLFIRDEYEINSGEDTRLNGPDIRFTFVGQVNTNTTDYLEQDPWWESTRQRGSLYLGSRANERLEIVTVLKRVSTLAAKSGLDLKDFYDVQYSKDVEDCLAFKFKDQQPILVGLQTGSVWIKE